MPTLLSRHDPLKGKAPLHPLRNIVYRRAEPRGVFVIDRAYFTLAGVIFAAIALDIFLDDGAALLFTLKKLADLVDYLVFWR